MPQKKLVDLEVLETSGVGHPAHLHEGWIVLKDASAQTVASVFGSEEGAAVSDDVVKERDDALARVAELEKQLADKVEKDADPYAGLPDSVRAAIRKSEERAERLEKQAQEDREALIKERETRLDTVAIAKSRDELTHVAIDHEKVAPALRKFAAVDPEGAKAVEEVLKAADGQLESAGIFSELGKSSSTSETGGSLEKIEAFAKELRAADPKLTKEGAFAKAAEAHPELYTAYVRGE